MYWLYLITSRERRELRIRFWRQVKGIDHQMCFLGLDNIRFDQLEVIELAKMSKGWRSITSLKGNLGTERPIHLILVAGERSQCKYVFFGTFLRIKQKCRKQK